MRRSSLDPICVRVFGFANAEGFSGRIGVSSIHCMVSARMLKGREECV